MTQDMNEALRRTIRTEPEPEQVVTERPKRRPRADAGAGRDSTLTASVGDDLNAALRAAWRGKRG